MIWFWAGGYKNNRKFVGLVGARVKYINEYD